jgi:hypothetical protein
MSDIYHNDSDNVKFRAWERLRQGDHVVGEAFSTETYDTKAA